eukprot:TRINITY_DN18160_c0_g1_i1.p1 TRINITY_DN18160_c0_g1~~TRINITY_DN18160_c0_g1_i1.p1  ORF type:complete len:511 (-),score=82.65 TRINITY_DN18160_c0_g1_i1:224-1756(-)
MNSLSLSLQEEWSPELLSELQRAVPVLENGSFDLDDDEIPGGGSRTSGSGQGPTSSWSIQNALAGWPHTSREDSGLRWGGWAQEAGQLVGAGSFQGSLPDDLLSDNAMALPMSTLTSGKRKTYPNKSTFQAHVCCVMDPLQVPRVIESLRESAHFKSVRSWTYAYRIVSPFDGQTHESSEDDNDVGAGEKMLGLLKRMGLENLLLVISRWDLGSSNRLGAELFKCVNEQCKDLLKELQQAVRESLPADELLLGRSRGYSSGTTALQDGQGDESGVTSLLGSEQGGQGGLGSCESDQFEDTGLDPLISAGATSRHVDLRAVGATPSPELFYASRGVCVQPTRRLPGMMAGSPPKRSAAAGPCAGAPELCVQRCSVVPRARTHTTESRMSSEASGVLSAREQGGSHDSRGGSASHDGLDQGSTVAAFLTELESADSGHTVSARMSNEELLQMCKQLRSERESLTEELEVLGKHEEVIKNLKMPLFLETQTKRDIKRRRHPTSIQPSSLTAKS